MCLFVSGFKFPNYCVSRELSSCCLKAMQCFNVFAISPMAYKGTSQKGRFQFIVNTVNIKFRFQPY
jgi:hypothetical protein